MSEEQVAAQWLTKHQWPPAKAHWLESRETKDFIEKYLYYRKGYSKGAKGELSQVGLVASAKRRPDSPPSGKAGAGRSPDADDRDTGVTDTYLNEECEEEEEGDFSSIFETVEDAQYFDVLRQLEAWRRAYRLFRTGSNRGAEGEISRLATLFTKEHFRLLPVAQLASYFAEQARARTAEARDCTFHSHIGGGRLGCGLVLPVMCASGAPFAVLQMITRKLIVGPSAAPSPVLAASSSSSKATTSLQQQQQQPADSAAACKSDQKQQQQQLPLSKYRYTRGSEWVPVMERPDRNFTLPFTINGEPMCDLLVIRDLQELLATGFAEPVHKDVASHGSPAEIAANYKLKIPPRGTPEALRCRMLVLDVTLHDLFLTQSDAISTALGPGLEAVAKHLASTLPRNPALDRTALYCCENDHKAVAAVRPILTDHLNVRECMVDRICSDRIVEPTEVQVIAEPYGGEIVVTARDSLSVKPGFGSSAFHLPNSAAAYSYLYTRKVLLVNGSHTTLAFMTLRRYCKPDEAPGDFELLTPQGLAPSEQTELRAWLAARCLVLLHNNETEVMRGVHGVSSDAALVRDLWAFAQRTALRFDTVRDSTKRVLGGGVANRYETRLKDVLTTLVTFEGSVPLAQLLLDAAGFDSIGSLITQLRTLVIDASVFV